MAAAVPALRLALVAALLAASLGCPGPAPRDTATPDTSARDTATPDTRPPDTGDTGPADTDPADTGDTPLHEGRLGTTGAATVAGTWDGTETVLLTDGATGAAACEVTVTLAATASRADCDLCDWAYTVAVTDARAIGEPAACAAIGWGDPGARIGSARGYGYVALYFGHAPVLMVETDGAWAPGGYAGWDPSTGALAYTLDGGWVRW